MKLNTIALYNIGPYVGRNAFDISTADAFRNIVLIGGKNGAGKTTFFKSIKTCLYGCTVWGFEAPCKEYYKLISQLVNERMQYDSTVSAYIELGLEFDDGKQVAHYHLHRSWEKKRRTITESFYIKKNGITLTDEELHNFVNYLLSIIPPDMFNFYFFDGEAISDFFMGSSGKKNFRNAFLKLYGLDTISLMIENFERFAKKNDVPNAVYERYTANRKAVEIVIRQLDSLKEQKAMLEKSLDQVQMQLDSLSKDYTKAGGVSISEWRGFFTDLAKEDAHREELNRWLKDTANHYLPFLLMEEQLRKLQINLEQEQSEKRHRIIFKELTSSEIAASLQEFLKANHTDRVTAVDIIRYLSAEFEPAGDTIPLFDLSDAQMQKILAQMYDKLNFDKESIQTSIHELENSLERTKALREKASGSSIDGFEEYSGKKNHLEQSIQSLRNELNQVLQSISDKETTVANAQSVFSKSKDEYEKLLRNRSIGDLSTRAVGTYTLLLERLVRKQGTILQQEFMKCFSAIINKEHFLDGIVVDDNINVIPYKLVSVNRERLENYLKDNEETHFLNLFDTSYQSSIVQLKSGIVNKVDLPSPITAPFSQGEQQVYIMSLYLALLKTSRKDIPFFIDTPFARIDSNHRSKIVDVFFKGIKNQIFILSTDEEIVGEYETMIEDNVSDRFLLDICEYGKTTVVPKKYFEVMI